MAVAGAVAPARGGKEPWHFADVLFPREAKQPGQPASNWKLIRASDEDAQRVVDLYKRHPSQNWDLKEVLIIWNEGLANRFEGQLDVLNRRHGKAGFMPHWHEKAEPVRSREQREQTVVLVNSLAERSRRFPRVTLVHGWHGTQRKHERDIMDTGFAALQKQDQGFFGKGVYTVLEGGYAIDHYARGAQGALFLNMVAWTEGLAFPVLASDIGQTVKVGGAAHENYEVHVVPVRPRSTHPLEINFDACAPGQKHTAIEVASFDGASVFPRYLVRVQPKLPAGVPGGIPMQQAAAPVPVSAVMDQIAASPCKKAKLMHGGPAAAHEPHEQKGDWDIDGPAAAGNPAGAGPRVGEIKIFSARGVEVSFVNFNPNREWNPMTISYGPGKFLQWHTGGKDMRKVAREKVEGSGQLYVKLSAEAFYEEIERREKNRGTYCPVTKIPDRELQVRTIHMYRNRKYDVLLSPQGKILIEERPK